MRQVAHLGVGQLADDHPILQPGLSFVAPTARENTAVAKVFIRVIGTVSLPVTFLAAALNFTWPGQMRRRRTPRPGVTAAATTAVFATGEGPGLTALATTAVFATGWPMTPTRPTRAGLSGISVSFGGRADEVVGLDGRDDRLDRDPSVGDELAARAPRG